MKIKNLVGKSISLAFIFSSSLAWSQNDSWYLSKVDKNSPHPFINRFATPSYHILVTTQPTLPAYTQIKFDRKADTSLIALELTSMSLPPLRGEIGRLDNVAFIEQKNENLAAQLHAYTLAGYQPVVIEDNGELPPPARASFRDNSLLFESSSSSHPFAGERLEIDPSWMEQKLKQLSGASAVVIGGSSQTIKERGSKAGKDLARAFLRAEYQRLGYQVSQQSYKTSRYEGINLIAEKEGADNSKTLIIGAHFDSVSNAGADDNGSGTIAALAVASLLKDVELKYNIRFVSFDQEEVGLIGSGAYVKKLQDENQDESIIAMIGIDIAGYDSDKDGKFHTIDCNEGNSPQLNQKVIAQIRIQNLPLTNVNYCTNRSDHASFWKAGIPATLISENYFKGDPNPCMHKACDTTANINFPYLINLAKLVAASAASLAAQP
jgi:hypothetical protein